jgi:hypothetical protein
VPADGKKPGKVEESEMRVSRVVNMVGAAAIAALVVATPAGAQSTLETLPLEMKLQLARAGDDEAQRAVGTA